MALKESIKQAAGKGFRVIPAKLPDGWECEPLFLRKLNVPERDAFESSRVRTVNEGKNVTVQLDTSNARSILLVKALCDADGKRIWTDDEIGDFGQMMTGEDADLLFEQAIEFNGLKKNEEVAPKNVLPPPAASPSA